MPSEKQKAYYEKNKERIRQRNREWGRKNRERKIQYMREYYQKNKEKIKAWNYANRRKKKALFNKRRKERTDERIAWLWRLKNTLACEHCGESHPACLEFHHRKGVKKRGAIGYLISHASLDVIEKEIKKCDVLCANCHRKLHWKMAKNPNKVYDSATTNQPL